MTAVAIWKIPRPGASAESERFFVFAVCRFRPLNRRPLSKLKDHQPLIVLSQFALGYCQTPASFIDSAPDGQLPTAVTIASLEALLISTHGFRLGSNTSPRAVHAFSRVYAKSWLPHNSYLAIGIFLFSHN